MNTLDPIHVAVFIHTLVQRTVAKNTLDGGHLKPLAGTGLVSRLFQQLRDTQHGNAVLMLLEDELHDRSFLLVNGENTIDHLVTVRTATTAVPTAGSLDGTTLAERCSFSPALPRIEAAHGRYWQTRYPL